MLSSFLGHGEQEETVSPALFQQTLKVPNDKREGRVTLGVFYLNRTEFILNQDILILPPVSKATDPRTPSGSVPTGPLALYLWEPWHCPHRTPGPISTGPPTLSPWDPGCCPQETPGRPQALSPIGPSGRLQLIASPRSQGLGCPQGCTSCACSMLSCNVLVSGQTVSQFQNCTLRPWVPRAPLDRMGPCQFTQKIRSTLSGAKSRPGRGHTLHRCVPDGQSALVTSLPP